MLVDDKPVHRREGAIIQWSAWSGIHEDTNAQRVGSDGRRSDGGRRNFELHDKHIAAAKV